MIRIHGQNYLTHMTYNCNKWSKYAKLEYDCGETERCQALYELAVNQPLLNIPEMLWKYYIDVEILGSGNDRARKLYQPLLDRTGYVNVWILYEQFEGMSNPNKCCYIFQNPMTNSRLNIRRKKMRSYWIR